VSPLLLGHADEVGPVLAAGRTAEAVIAAISAENGGVSVVSRGAYVRVRVPRRCVLTRARVEEELGETFELPGDLEAIMPAFVGRITIHTGSVEWSL
jgi:toluene monooxygenase system protein D